MGKKERAQPKNFWPKKENLGKNCELWNPEKGCMFVKAEMRGRRSCEGIIDNVCLYLKGKTQPPTGFTQEQLKELKTRIPGVDWDPFDIPPGETGLEEILIQIPKKEIPQRRTVFSLKLVPSV